MNCWSFLVLAAIACATTYAQERMRVCTVTNWAQFRPYPATYFPNQTDPSLCSHIFFAFAVLDPNNNIVPQQWNDDTPGGLYDQTIALKQRQPGLKVSISVGGYNMGMTQASIMLSTPANRATFINSVLNFTRTRDFDGVDLCFQYPGSPGTGSPPQDKFHYTSLLKEFRTAIDNEAISSGKAPLLLTAAVSAHKAIIDTGYEVPNISQYLDFITIMTYDYNGGWDTITGMNAPLYPRADEFGANREMLNVDWSADYWVLLGAPNSKLLIGLALYGRSFTLLNAAQHDVGAPVTGSGWPGSYTREGGFLAYYEVCIVLSTGAIRVFNDEHKNPYAYENTQWVGYDDEESLKFKVDYILANGFAGWAAWNTDLDDFSGALGCNAGPFPLLSAANRFLTNSTATAAPTSTLAPLLTSSTAVPPNATSPANATFSTAQRAAKRPAPKKNY